MKADNKTTKDRASKFLEIKKLSIEKFPPNLKKKSSLKPYFFL